MPEEALEDDFKSFDMAVRVLTLKDYDYLDFRNEAFDKDYVDFLTRMDSLTERLQVKVHLRCSLCPAPKVPIFFLLDEFSFGLQ